MNLIDNISHWWRAINRRRRVSVFNTANGKEWRTHISPVRAVMVSVAVVVSLFLLMLILVGYTSFLETLPMYRTAAERTRDRLIENIVKIDSMQRVIGDMIIYNENVGLILEGKTPVVRTTISSDSVRSNRTFTPPSAIDSALRAQMEGQGAYSLNAALEESKSHNNNITFIAPVEGIVIARFSVKEGLYGVRIAATSEVSVVAVEDGVVVHSMWSPQGGNMVEILHADNTITIYKNMSESLVSKADRVSRGEIIGYNNKSVDNPAEQLFEFEMWRDGKPTNPERYIIF